MLRKKLMFILLILITLTVFTGCNSIKSEEIDKDDEEIIKTALDYIEGWYEGDAKRMERALHTDMIKRRFESNGIMKELDTDRMIASTKGGVGKDVPKDIYEIEVEILEKNNNIASVVTRSEYIDYLHLAKIDNKWLIINVLWDFNRADNN